LTFEYEQANEETERGDGTFSWALDYEYEDGSALRFTAILNSY
jgi:hypothetical protein